MIDKNKFIIFEFDDGKMSGLHHAAQRDYVEMI
jgi:hypothetical protein